ncbi:MAG: LysR family transcriptional regulator [Oscillospiraceae bacterium]|nr:LysR family transcriptional regulator [Oscillospiraceae bacterium]
MDRTKVRIFLYVIDSGSLTKAAAAFGYTTSGISHMMSTMEEEVGFPLLIRSRSGVAPTPNAERLIPILRSQLSWDEQLQQTISEISGMNSGSITVAAYSSIASQWLPTVISRFHRDYGAIEIHLLEGTWQEVAGYLGEHRADMGFYSYQPSIKYHWVPLKNDPMVVCVPPQHPLAEHESVRLADLKDESIILPAYGMDMDVQNLLRGHSFRCQFTTLENSSAFSMAEQGLGLVITHELNTRGRINRMKILPLDPPQTISLGVAFPSDTQLTPAASKLIEYAKMIIRDSSVF